MKKEISLPFILDQKNTPSCAAYAVAGLANYYLKLKGIDDQIDPIKLYNENERGVPGTTTDKLLTYGQNFGLPSIKNKRYLVKEFLYVPPILAVIEKNLNQFGGLIFNYDLFDKDSFQRRLDENGVLTRRPITVHSMVLVGYDNDLKRMKVANSWGERFGNKGYFYIPYVLINKTYVSTIYSLTLK